MATLSNNTKVVLFNDNMVEIGTVLRGQCHVVQHYDFTLNRSRNATGEVYGLDAGSTLTLSVRIGSKENLIPFYQRLNSNEMSYFSFIFNARYDAMNIVEDYDSAIVVSGYLVDIIEEYNRHPDDDTPQMLMHISILIRNVKHLSARITGA